MHEQQYLKGHRHSISQLRFLRFLVKEGKGVDEIYFVFLSSHVRSVIFCNAFLHHMYIGGDRECTGKGCLELFVGRGGT